MKQDFTFGNESTHVTRKGMLAAIEALTLELFDVKITKEQVRENQSRLDPRREIDVARREFLQRAHDEGLNGHEALHSWNDGMEMESESVHVVCERIFCSKDQVVTGFYDGLVKKMAKGLGRPVTDLN